MARSPRPSESKRTILSVPLGKRTVEVRSEGGPLSSDDWKSLARFCFASAAACGDPYWIRLEDGITISCDGPDEIFKLVEYLMNKDPRAAVVVAAEASKILGDTEKARMAAKIATS